MRRQTRLALARPEVRKGLWWSWLGGGLMWTAVVESSAAFELAWQLSGVPVHLAMALVALGAAVPARRWNAGPTGGVLAALGPLVVSGVAPGAVVVAVGLTISAACGGWVVGAVWASAGERRDAPSAAAVRLTVATAVGGILLLPLSLLWLSVVAVLMLLSGPVERATQHPATPLRQPADRSHRGQAGSVLEGSDLAVGYGTRRVLRGASIHAAPGELVALVGANGSGKSTLLRVLGGHLLPERGDLRFKGESVLGATPEELGRLGVALASGARPVFADLSVQENLVVAGWALGGDRQARQAHIGAALAEFPELVPLSRYSAGRLSGGEQRLLALAQSLVSQPAVLLADEVTLGLSPPLRRRVLSMLRSAADAGVAVVVVEHDTRDLTPLADRILRLENGVLRDESGGDTPKRASFIPERP